MSHKQSATGTPTRVTRCIASVLSTLWFFCAPAHADGNLGGLLTDLWFAAPFNSEPGWGLTVDHQDQVMFLTFYVYGPSGAPYWVVATLNHVPGTSYRFTGDLLETHGSWFGASWNSGAFGYRTVGTATLVSADLLNATLDYSVDGSRYTFTGDLYDAHGPWFGGPYGATPYVSRKVGTATFAATEPLHATLSYTVEGTPVNKPLERQTLRFMNFSGSYFGAISFVTSNCANPLDNGDVTADAGDMTITHSGSGMSIAYTGREAACTFAGTYGQSGELGTTPTTLSCGTPTGPIAGTLNLANMQWTLAGMTATVSGRLQNCDINGAIVGALRSR